ncbi:hypothetical protein H4217_008305, partial [Coemansia sp. RSA 1939]
YLLDVPASNMANMNTRQQLERICNDIHDHLRHIPHAPSVQMQSVPQDWPSDSDSEDGADDARRPDPVRADESGSNYSG